MKHLISYAQNREDVILNGFFENRKEGFYVDVGAGNPVDDSVTKLFYDRGWHGINIEPIGHINKALKKKRPRDINLNIGVSNKEGVLRFREYAADGFSTFSEAMMKEYDSNPNAYTKKYTDYKIKTLPLRQIFKEHNVKSIQFLKVDVEGYEYEVLESNDWKNYRPEVVCVEANHVQKDWRSLLKDNGYKKSFFDGLNEYYIDARSSNNIKFSYINAVISNEPIVNYRLLNEINQYKEEIENLKREDARKEEHIKYIESLLKDAQTRLEEISSLTKHIKRTAKSGASRVRRKILKEETKK
jgi:FkbM family methyltransferase